MSGGGKKGKAAAFSEGLECVLPRSANDFEQRGAVRLSHAHPAYLRYTGYVSLSLVAMDARLSGGAAAGEAFDEGIIDVCVFSRPDTQRDQQLSFAAM